MAHLVSGNQSNDHWSQYWQFGALTSLPQDFELNYDGELADFWRAIVEQVPVEASVVDVCTGNLALPLLLSQFKFEVDKQLKVTAVDLAKIEKSKIALRHPNLEKVLQTIHVIDQTAIEVVGEKIMQPVDLITSQYGLEYCDIPKVAPKLVELLKPGGRLVFVAHAADTSILSAMKQEQLAFDWLQENGIFKALKDFGEGGLKAVGFQEKLQKQIKLLHIRLLASPIKLLQIFHQALGGLSQLTVQQLRTQQAAVLKFYREHWMAQMRAHDLLAVSEKIGENPHWYHPFEQEGLLLQDKQVIWYQGKHNAGTAFQFIKPTT